MTGQPPAVDLEARLTRVRARIAEAAAAAGRAPADVRLIGVTKTHPPELGRAAVAAGLVSLGENRVQELLAKLPQVPGAQWHLVGNLQRNKVKDVVGRAVLVHTLDRRSLADALSRRAEQQGTVQRVLVQVNVADDPAKHGCPCDETLALVAYARDLPHLVVEGLMTVPPLPAGDDDPSEAARPHFATLRRLRDDARKRFPEVVHLSMGMSADLEAAVSEGATMIRIGTALFGPRQAGPWRPQEVGT
ncbi:YggS family pyridoxal phosphate-dependent enzyme [Egicoccus halophilus]|uniref:Pyridoxal phosphate homeostasis protein n=1 Tax=Egicoccus halophilus TaxID=1670830 RepID=A0A8J3A873_9ACTN|nr:YggS family pyridoxal phosphate-dependent enzyme [Egicoccus halophilus]GGI04339.1 YggS family pyridoxal phosphate enzyme [Egicoccus halophilus]